MKSTLTKRFIDGIKAPAKGRVRYGDTKQPGLHLYVYASGKQTWFVYRKLDGKPVEYRIGDYPAISPETARTLAAAAVAKMAAGVDVQEERVQARRQPKLSQLWGHYLETHAKPHKRPRSVYNDERNWKQYLEAWGNRRLSSITYEAVVAWHAEIGREHGRYEANRALALLSAMFNRARELGYRGENPARGVKHYAEPSRERFLAGDEIRRLYVALEAEDQDTRDFVKLALLTGGRRKNLLGMAWADVDLVACVWTVPAVEAKAGKAILIPLCNPALAILARRKESTAGSPWVFPAAAPTQPAPYHALRMGWQRARAAARIPDVRLHDLRRSLATLAVASGASLPAVGKLLGHAGLQATQVYARADLAAIRAAVSGAVGLIEHATEGQTDG
jgi:integrase